MKIFYYIYKDLSDIENDEKNLINNNIRNLYIGVIESIF